MAEESRLSGIPVQLGIWVDFRSGIITDAGEVAASSSRGMVLTSSYNATDGIIPSENARCMYKEPHQLGRGFRGGLRMNPKISGGYRYGRYPPVVERSELKANQYACLAMTICIANKCPKDAHVAGS
jgi:hypothetical protein